MLDRGDIDLNSVHSFREKKTIKQTMLNHELVFRRQVFELHKLYRVQTAMMEDLKQKDLDNYNLHSIGMSPIPVNLNDQYKYSMKPLDLQLSADEFISQCDDGFSGKKIVTSLEESIVSKHSSQDKIVLDLDHPKLSLSIGQDARLKDTEHRSWKGKEIYSSSIGITDLKDANVSFSNYEAYLEQNSGYLAPKSCHGDMHNLDSFIMSGKQKLECFAQSGIRDGSYGATLSRFPVDAGPSCQTQSLCDLGFSKHHRKFLLANLFNENRESSMCKVNNLDLNTVQFEDPSYVSNNHSMVGNSSITSSSPVLEKVYHKSYFASSISPASWRKADANQLMDLHDICQQKDLNLEDEGNKCGMVGEFREGNRVHISHVNVESDSPGELCSARSDPKNSSVGSSSKIPNDPSCEMNLVDTGAKVPLKKVGEPYERHNCCKVSSSSESECMEHQSSSIKTMQSGVGCGDINISTYYGREKASIDPLATHSGEQELRAFDGTGSNTECINTKEAEVDGAVQIAAEVLVQISMVREACCQGDLAKVPLKKFQSEAEDQPQCSSDSYEAMVLKAEESSPYDYCVSSNAFLVDESEKKDVKYKLKRGTRMKDFQKDILPCLSTLSRHEIREDVNILEGVIRSHEYKRMRGKMADGGGDWCRSTRSKRSRAGRKYYV